MEKIRALKINLTEGSNLDNISTGKQESSEAVWERFLHCNGGKKGPSERGTSSNRTLFERRYVGKKRGDKVFHETVKVEIKKNKEKEGTTPNTSPTQKTNPKNKPQNKPTPPRLSKRK